MGSQIDLAYCAGVIDSDGCITIKRRRVKTNSKWSAGAAVFVRQVTDEAVTLLQHLFGGKVRQHAASTPGGRPLFQWYVDRAKAVAVATALLPYLRIKKRQAQILIEFDEFISDHRGRCLVSYFQWKADEPCYSVDEACAVKGVQPATIYQAISNGSIPSRRSKDRRRWIPKRFWDFYRCRQGRQLPIEYIERRDEFVSRIRSLNGPTRGVTTAMRIASQCTVR